MLKAVEKLAKGQVNIEPAVLKVEPAAVSLELVESTSMTGEIVVSTMGGESVKGIIYTSDPRMEVLSNYFAGSNCMIRYEVHGDYMFEGDELSGYFYIIAECGEYKVPFHVVAKKLYAQASVGKIDSIAQFVKLYKSSMKEALHVFGAPAFVKILENDTERQYYRLLSERPATMHNLEEFLIVTGKKTRVSLSMDDKGRLYRGLDVIVTDSFSIRMSDWGYTQLDVSCDSEFVTLIRDKYTSDDFLAGVVKIEYKINPNLLHRGKCMARIHVESIDQSFDFEITCMPEREMTDDGRYHRRQVKEKFALMDCYVKYLSGEKVLGQWASETTRIIEQRYIRGEASRLDNLWAAYAYKLNGQAESAEEILTEFKRLYDNNDSRQWALYLMICLIDEPEENRRQKMMSQIRELYTARPRDKWLKLIMFLALSNLEKDEKIEYQVLLGWFKEGVSSPVLYAFAAKLLLAQPYILSSIGEFELQTLNWMRKKKIISKDLSDQIGHISPSLGQYRLLTDELLSYCYETYREIDMLASVCAYRIRGERFDAASVDWYAMAIKHDLKITGLYEAYINSVDLHSSIDIPESVLIYFQYSNLLSYSRKALLYANIIKNRGRYTEIYNRYLPIMQSFAQAEIAANHIDDSLAVVYEHMLGTMEITQTLAENLSEILYANKLMISDDKEACDRYKNVVILHENLKEPQEYPVVDGCAIFPVYSGNFVILLKDKRGRYVAGKNDNELMRLFNPGRYIRTCLEKAPNKLSYIMHHMSGKVGLLDMDKQMAYFARALVDSDIVSDDYKSKIGPGVLEYLKTNEPLVNTKNYLLKIDYSKLNQRARKDYLESLVGLGMFDEAWSFIVQYGAGELEIEYLKKIVLSQLDANDPAEDEQLVYYAKHCFDNQVSDKRIVKYLMKYYCADARHMAKVYRASKNQGIKSAEFLERVLILMAISRTFVKESEEIFVEYCNTSPTGVIRRAYLNYFSYMAYISNMKLSEEFYHILEQSMQDGFKLCDYCRLALIKYYSSLNVISANRVTLLNDLVTYFLSSGRYYDIFSELPEKILIRHHLYDVVLVPYRGLLKNGEVFANFRYSSQDPFEQERLDDATDSLYLFKKRLAPGESIELYFTENGDRMRRTTEIKKYEAPGVDVDYNFYNRLGSMNELNRYTQALELNEQAINYKARVAVTDKIFKTF